MSVIREIEKQHLNQLDASRRRLEQRVKGLSQVHRHHETELKKAHEDQLIELKQNHQHQATEENQKKEKVLEEMKSHLNQTRALTDKELFELKDFSDRQINQLKNKFIMDQARINQENELTMNDLNERFNLASGESKEKGKLRLQKINSDIQDQIREKQDFNARKMERDQELFSKKIKNNEMNYLKLKNQQDNLFSDERKMAHLKQEEEIKNITDIQNKNMQTLNTQFRKSYLEQERSFESNFKNQMNQFNDSFKRIEEKNKKIVEELKNSLTQKISQIAEKNSDDFYQFETINPRMTELEDRVEIKVDIPEYAKKELTLTTNLKEVIVNFNRRYHDATRSDEGVINKVNKVESFSTRLPTSRLLDPKTITSSYENGTMTFNIKYA